MPEQDSREQTEAYLRSLTPPGYARQFVQPPWPRQGSACRSCRAQGGSEPAHPGALTALACAASGPRLAAVIGRPTRWAVVTLVRRHDGRKLVQFTFAMCCAGCATDAAKVAALADRAFSEVH